MATDQEITQFIVDKGLLDTMPTDQIVDRLSQKLEGNKDRARFIVSKAAKSQIKPNKPADDAKLTFRKFANDQVEEVLPDIKKELTSPETAAMVGSTAAMAIPGAGMGAIAARLAASGLGSGVVKMVMDVLSQPTGEFTADAGDVGKAALEGVAMQGVGEVAAPIMSGISRKLSSSVPAEKQAMIDAEKLQAERIGKETFPEELQQISKEQGLAEAEISKKISKGENILPSEIGEAVRDPLAVKDAALRSKGGEIYESVPVSEIKLREKIPEIKMPSAEDVAMGIQKEIAQTAIKNQADDISSQLLSIKNKFPVESTPLELTNAITQLGEESISSAELGRFIRQLRDKGFDLSKTDKYKGKLIFDAANSLKSFYKDIAANNPAVKQSYDEYLKANKWWATNVSPLSRGATGEILQKAEGEYVLPKDHIVDFFRGEKAETPIRKLMSDLGDETTKDIAYQQFVMDLSRKYKDKNLSASSLNGWVNSNRVALKTLWGENHPFKRIKNIQADLDSYQKAFLERAESDPSHMVDLIMKDPGLIGQKMKSLKDLLGKTSTENISAVRQRATNWIADEYSEMPINEAFKAIERDYPDFRKVFMPETSAQQLTGNVKSAIETAKKAYSGVDPKGTIETAVALLAGKAVTGGASAVKSLVHFHLKRFNEDAVNKLMIKSAYDPEAAKLLTDMAKGFNTKEINARLNKLIGAQTTGIGIRQMTGENNQ